MFLVNYPCSQPTSDIPVNTAPSPTSQTCSQTARHQEKLAHHCLPHFSALWVFIKLGNQGKPAYLKQPIRSPHPAVSSTYQPHSIKLSVSEGDLITPIPSPASYTPQGSILLILALFGSVWLILWEATNNQRSVQRLSSLVNN